MSHSRTLSFFLPLRPTFSVFYFALMFFKETFYVLMLRFLEIRRCFCEFCFVMLNNLIWQKQLCKNNNILVVCAGAVVSADTTYQFTFDYLHSCQLP